MPVGDGTWRLKAANGSGGTFTVRGGGRIVYAIPLSGIVAECDTDTTPGSSAASSRSTSLRPARPAAGRAATARR